MKQLFKNLLRTFGYDIVKMPYPGSLDRHVQELLNLFEVNCVFDVGARHGEYGAWLRSIGYRGRIVSFEPVAESFRILRRQADGRGDWRPHNLALGSKSESKPISVMQGDALSSFLAPNAYNRAQFGPDSKIVATEEVRVETLDNVFDECVAGLDGPRCYLKIDTQGWDLEVIKGAARSLQYVRVLQSEVSVQKIYDAMPSWFEAIGIYNGLGFCVSGLYPVKYEESRTVIEFDCVLVRKK